MFRLTRPLASALVVAGVALGASTAGATASVPVQKLAVPAYFDPGAQWTQMEQGYPAVGIAIMNPDSGPGNKRDLNYVTQVRKSQTAGLSVIGYTDVAYQKPDRPLRVVEAEIDKYYAWYHVDGIFLDEANTDCADVPTYYAKLYTYIKTKGGKAIVMLNPGTATNECYMAVTDIVVTFEDSYSTYVHTYSAPSWVGTYAPSRFEHIVYAAPTDANMSTAIALSKQRHAGWVYVTNDVLDNPYDHLPTGQYWADELALAAVRRHVCCARNVTLAAPSTSSNPPGRRGTPSHAQHSVRGPSPRPPAQRACRADRRTQRDASCGSAHPA